MKGAAGNNEPGRRCGQTLVEFSIVAFLTVMMLLFVLEMSRAMLVVTTVAQAARAGVRYAIVHGSTRPATGCAIAADCASGPGNFTQVVTVVTNFAGVGPLNTNLFLTTPGKIAVTYPDSGTPPGNAPGQHVKITVMYPYDPLTSYFSKNSLSLNSTAQGIIVY